MRTLDDGLISRLLRDPALVAAFPFLLAKMAVNSRSCCGEPAKVGAPDYQKIKAHIAALGPEQQKKLLGNIGAPKLRIVYRKGQKINDRVVDLQ